jgi:AmpD protein
VVDYMLCRYQKSAPSMLSIENHILQDVRFLESPNFSERPQNEEISLLVIHNISLPPGEFGTQCIEQLFCNKLDCDAHPYFDSLRELRVSSHLLIDRCGEITQFVPFNLKAWHAGDSEFDGRNNCNEFSIGIELEGTDFETFTELQYEKLVEITSLLLVSYKGLTPNRIVGHSDIAPQRKTDPGPFFDWNRFLGALEA